MIGRTMATFGFKKKFSTFCPYAHPIHENSCVLLLKQKISDGIYIKYLALWQLLLSPPGLQGKMNFLITWQLPSVVKFYKNLL